MIPAHVLLPILLPFQPLHQLLLHPLVTVDGGHGGAAAPPARRTDGVHHQAERREEGDVEQVGLLRIVNSDHWRRSRPDLAEQVGKQPPLGGVLVAGVPKGAIVLAERRGGVSGEKIALHDAVGELPREIVQVDLGPRRRSGGIREDGGSGGGRRRQGEETGPEGQREDDEDERGGHGGDEDPAAAGHPWEQEGSADEGQRQGRRRGLRAIRRGGGAPCGELEAVLLAGSAPLRHPRRREGKAAPGGRKDSLPEGEE